MAQAFQQEKDDVVNCGVFALMHFIYIAAKRDVPTKADARLWRFLFSCAIQPDGTLPAYSLPEVPELGSNSEFITSERYLEVAKVCKLLSTNSDLADEASQVLSSISHRVETAKATITKDLEATKSDIEHWESILERASQSRTSHPDDDAALKQLLNGFIVGAESRTKTLRAKLKSHETHIEATRSAVAAASGIHSLTRSRLEEAQKIRHKAAQWMQTIRLSLRTTLSKMEADMKAADEL